MDRKLFMQAMIKFLAGILLTGVLIFIPAGTFKYLQGWLLMTILFIPMFIAGIIMLKKSPELLRKRLNMKEEQSEQRAVILFSSLMFIISFSAAGICYRFHMLMLPAGISLAAAVVFLFAYGIFAKALCENPYLSRTVEVQEKQNVIDTGLYGIVRHPMYMGTILLFLSMPLVLGSIISFVVMMSYIPIIDKRIRNEEQVLEEGLEGYKEYKQKVRFKVIPHIW